MEWDRFDRISVGIGVIFLNGMFVLGITQVLNRYVGLPFSLHWLGELSRHFLALMTIIALPYLFKNDADISFLPVLERVVSRLDVFLIIRNILLAAFAFIFVWSAYLAYNIQYNVTLPTLGWFHIRWGYLLIGVSFIFLLVYLLVDTRHRIKSIHRRTSEIRENSDV